MNKVSKDLNMVIRINDEDGNPINIDITDDEEGWAQDAGREWDERDRALDREP